MRWLMMISLLAFTVGCSTISGNSTETSRKPSSVNTVAQGCRLDDSGNWNMKRCL